MTTNTQNTFSITAVVEALIQDRCKWEEGSYAVSNSELYALLGRTLDLYLKVRADRALAKSVNHLLELFEGGILFGYTQDQGHFLELAQNLIAMRAIDADQCSACGRCVSGKCRQCRFGGIGPFADKLVDNACNCKIALGAPAAE